MSRAISGWGAIVLAAVAWQSARAEFRHALVIGNATYPGHGLASPQHDAEAVGEALRARGFAVTEAVDLTAEQLRETVANFSVMVPTRGTALVYFAGLCVPTPHATNQDTLLLGIDHGDLAKPSQLENYGMTARQILAQLATEFREPPIRGQQILRRQGGSLTNILILDGCYPVAGLPDGSPRGLVKGGTPMPESMVIYAAQWGETIEPAKDGLSPLATQLVTELGSSKTLDAVLAAIGAARESTLGDLSFLKQPASRSISPPTKLPAGDGSGDEWVNDYGMVFCRCPPGSFTIGAGPPASRQSPWDDQTDELQADVAFAQGFWIGKYECTLRDMRATMTALHRSTGTHKLHPMNRASFRLYDWRRDFEGMIAKLNETAPEGWVYDMPSEAEWEYAARAGATTSYSFGDDPTDLARHGNFADRTLRESASKGEAGDSNLNQQPPHYTGLFSYAHETWSDGHATPAIVGSYPPNAWGLHDVHGNVCEVTCTPYHANRVPLSVYAGEKMPREAVTKGGSWLSVPSYCRLAFRGLLTCSEEHFEGLRLVLRRKDVGAVRLDPSWTTLVPTRFTSTAGSDGSIAADGSVLVTGKPVKDTYIIETVVPEGIVPRAIRLEALPDQSLPHQGPGRTGNGAFFLNEFTVQFGPPRSTVASKPLVFLHVFADVQHGSGPVARAVDGEPSTWWSTYGSSGKDISAVFVIRLPGKSDVDGSVWKHPSTREAESSIPQPGSPLVITLDHPNAATIGRFRLSVTEDDVVP